MLFAVLWLAGCKAAPVPGPQAAGSIRYLSHAEFQDRLDSASGTVLVDFFADWCYPCKVLSPIVAEVAIDMAGRVTVYKVNVDNAKGLARSLKIDRLPTLILFKDGKEIKRITGLVEKTEILKLFL